ncbi:MAG: VIT1/CCC1 transporter family protein [Actinomycetota bacterium]|nr:VIT1/CCC1 transporter family protein [Actinomycetota bacterium]
MKEVPEDVRRRLLKAWKGEVVAGAVYDLIARRLADREADILRRMSEAESGHRTRLEERMRELEIPVPNAQSVRLPLWTRLQARIAPVDRLLAAREAAEDEEVDDLYKRSTGDAATDLLLREIRKEERSHSLAVQDLRDGRDGRDGRQANRDSSRYAGESPPIAVPGAQARLDRILGREKWHRSGGGWISGAIYGANDGLAAVFGIVAGVSGATGGSKSVLTAGLAGAIASALSMATGAFLAERSEAEVAAANIERERQEIAQHPEEEREELSLFYELKGIDEQTADELAERMSRHPDAMLQALAAEEFGSRGTDSDPAQAALAAGISTGLGAIIPVIPFMITTGTTAIIAAAGLSLVAHFLVGAAKSLVTLRTWWAAGLEMTLAGVIVGGATYLVGLALPG